MASKHRTPPTLGKKGNMLEYDIIKPKPIFWLFGEVVKNPEKFSIGSSNGSVGAHEPLVDGWSPGRRIIFI